MADPIYGLTATAAKQTGQVVRQVLRTLPPTGRRTRRVVGSPGAATWYWGKLSTALSGGSMTTPQTCEVNVWEADPASTADPVAFIVTTNPDLLGVTVVNRDPTAIASVGTVCKIHKGGGEASDHWSLLWLGCSE